MPLFCCCSSSAVPPMVFEHTVTGAEVGFGTDAITIPLPAVRANTNYIAIASDGGRVDLAQALYTAPESGYAVGSVVVIGPIAAIGDKIDVTINQKTA